MAGRRPKPTKLRVIEGNLGKRTFNQAEPELRVASADVPDGMSTGGAKEWNRIAGELCDLGLLTEVSRSVFRLYCEAIAEHDAASIFLRENGLTYVVRDKDGEVRSVGQFPQVAIARNAAERARKLAIEFGLTPAAASKVRVPKKPPAKTGAEFVD